MVTLYQRVVLVASAVQYKMGMKSFIFSIVLIFPILGGPTEVDAGFLSSAAKTLTRLKMRLDARLGPNRDNDVVRRLDSYQSIFLLCSKALIGIQLFLTINYRLHITLFSWIG